MLIKNWALLEKIESSKTLEVRVKKNHSSAGQSIIEVIVALGIFLIIVTSSVIAVLASFSVTRLAQEKTQAVNLATEGLEAVKSIRNQNWDNLVTGNYGVVNNNGVWSLSPQADLDPSAKFTRLISINDVNRDLNHDLLTTGGTLDPETKKISSQVTWNFTPTRFNTVTMTLYLTNWQLSRIKLLATPTPTLTPTPTTVPNSCASYCQSLLYTTGTCRANTNQCRSNGEVYVAAGDAFCTGGANVDTCCCAP